MLSAEKDANRATAPRVFASNGGAVGKVVNSIQSLRQRLTDYTLEEVADAENRSRSLLVGLSNLQLRLGSLAAIKESMTAVHEAIEQRRSEDVVVTAYELSDQPLHVKDIVQASKLLAFPTRQKISTQPFRDVADNSSLPSRTSSVAKETPQFIANLIEARPDEVTKKISVGPDEPSFIFDSEQMGGALPDSAANFSWDEETGANLPTEILDAVNFDEAPQENAANLTEASNTNGSTMGSRQDQPHGRQEEDAARSTTLVPSGGDFDQRLLDDLIKNYGEFFTSADSRAKRHSQSQIQSGESASAKILETPVVESAHEKTARALPLKKEGDINRQLKKIIKDYGEYDIYSRQSPFNLKVAIIGGFFLLGSLLLGFYLLWSSNSQESSSLPASIQRESLNKIGPEIPSLNGRVEATREKGLNKSIVVKK